MPNQSTRRFFLENVAGLTGSLLVPAVLARPSKPEKDGLEVTPNEDLMREHGLLRRVLLIYDESVTCLIQHTKGKPDSSDLNVSLFVPKYLGSLRSQICRFTIRPSSKWGLLRA